MPIAIVVRAPSRATSFGAVAEAAKISSVLRQPYSALRAWPMGHNTLEANPPNSVR